MPNDLDRKLLETDLDRIITLAQYLPTGIACDLEEQEKCSLSNTGKHDTPRNETRELVQVVDLKQLKRELVEFRRKFKELYGS